VKLDVPAIYNEWRRLVIKAGVRGKVAHDARIAAAMTVHGLTRLLTFNTSDFKPFQAITAIAPADLIGNTVP
jgi:predicted nucleic acid-binding protein